MTRRRRLWIAAALAVLILGVRWACIDRYGTELPFMDQWDAEARMLLIPWQAGDHRLALFFQPHNEHRVALTRAVALAWTAWDHQWDQRLEAVGNALLPALLAAGLLIGASRRLGRGALAGLTLLLAVFYATPLAWENIVHGFHSQQFFLLDLGVGALALFASGAPSRGRWGLACALVLLSLGSMATGFFAGAVCLAIIAVRGWRREVRGSLAWPALAICAAACVMGATTQVTVPGHAVLRAQSLAEFGRSLAGDLGWPAFSRDWGYSALLLWLPWTLLAVRFLRGRRVALFPLALGAWGLLQVVAMAYGRSAASAPPAVRYLDTLFIGLLANALALAGLLADDARDAGALRRERILAGLWFSLLTAGLAAEERSALAFLDAPDYAREIFYEEANVRNYVATGDAAYLHHVEIPYPDETLLRRELDDPRLRPLLPAAVRAPLALTTASTHGFATVDLRRPESAGPAAENQTGLPPGAGRLTNRLYRSSWPASGSTTDASWRSQPLSASRERWLAFPVAGDLGKPGTALVLRDAATAREVARVLPDQRPGAGWHSVLVRAPRAPFVVEASVRGSGVWFAFGDPIEMGGASHAAWRLTRRGWWIALAGGCGVLLGLLIPGGCRSDISRGPASRSPDR